MDSYFLSISRSEAENDFIRGLIPRETWIWIGINVMEKEGVFVSVDGGEVSWTNWATGQPNDYDQPHLLGTRDGVDVHMDYGGGMMGIFIK